jgi:hypothetical protein
LQFGSFLRVMIAASITVSRLSWIPGTRPLARHPRGCRTSARIRSKIRRAVWRCFRGAFRSDSRIASIYVAAVAIFTAGRSVFLRCAGTALLTASRTMRRCTPNFRATPITDPYPNS